MRAVCERIAKKAAQLHRRCHASTQAKARKHNRERKQQKNNQGPALTYTGFECPAWCRIPASWYSRPIAAASGHSTPPPGNSPTDETPPATPASRAPPDLRSAPRYERSDRRVVHIRPRGEAAAPESAHTPRFASTRGKRCRRQQGRVPIAKKGHETAILRPN